MLGNPGEFQDLQESHLAENMTAEDDGWGVESGLDALQMGLAGIGMLDATGIATGGVGTVVASGADLLDAAISLGRAGYDWMRDDDDYAWHLADAGLAGYGAIPVAGLPSGPARMAMRTAKAARRAKQAERVSRAFDPLTKIGPDGKMVQMTLDEAREFAKGVLGKVGSKGGITPPPGWKKWDMDTIRKKLADVPSNRLWDANQIDKMRRVGGAGASPVMDSVRFGGPGKAKRLGEWIDGTRAGAKVTRFGDAAVDALDFIPGFSAGRRIAGDWASDMTRTPFEFGARGTKRAGRGWVKQADGTWAKSDVGRWAAGRNIGRAKAAGFYGSKGLARAERLGYNPLGDDSPGFRGARAPQEVLPDYLRPASDLSSDEVKSEAEANFVRKNVIDENGVLVPTATTSQAALAAKVAHHQLVKDNPDADAKDLHVKGAPGWATRHARATGGIVTHHPSKPGKYMVVDRQSFQRMPPMTYRQKKNIDAIMAQERKEERIARNPTRYEEAFRRRAQRKMRMERKRVVREGNKAARNGDWQGVQQAQQRIAMLDLDIGDPNHPQVLLRMGAFNNRGLGGTNQRAYFDYLKNYTAEQNKKRDLTEQEQIWFAQSHLGEGYKRRMTELNTMESNLMQTLTVAPDKASRAEILAGVQRIRLRRQAVEEEARRFTNLYSQIDRSGKRSTVPRISTQYLPAEARLLPAFAGPDPNSVGGIKRGTTPYESDPEAMSVTDAVSALMTPPEENTISESVVRLAEQLEKDPTFGPKILDWMRTRTAGATSPRHKRLMKRFRYSEEEARAVDSIDQVTGDNIQLKRRLIAGMGIG